MIEKQFLEIIDQKELFTAEDKILVAVSGGKDSMALLNLCYESGLNIEAAHFNFKLRGKESDLDQKLVEEFCKKRDIKLHINTADTQSYADTKGISIQMAARELRYEWFQELRELRDLQYIATAHHANDNLETLILNIAKGSGPRGLTGIPDKTYHIIRPLLGFSSQQIGDYLLGNNIVWREDSSNQENQYARNKIRNQIIPLLKEINPGILNTSKNNLKRFKELNSIFELQYKAFKSQIISENDVLKIPHNLILKTTGSFLFLEELLKNYNFNINDVESIFQIRQPGKKIISSTHILSYDREYWSLQETQMEQTGELTVYKTGQYEFDNHLFTLKETKQKPESFKNPNLAVLNAESIHWPLTIRYWRAGDRFTPYGMKGSKLVSDYLKDIKADSVLKNKQTIVADQHQIIWLTGLRTNDKNKVDNNCKLFLQILFESK